MYRNTILRPVACDLRQLPLGAVEAFVLSQVDGRMMLDEIAVIAGLEFAETSRIAERLLELGAVEPADDPRSRRQAMRAATKAARESPPPRSLRPGAAHKS